VPSPARSPDPPRWERILRGLDGERSAWACALPMLLAVPFLGKAFHMDDPQVLIYARLLTQHPLDPFRQVFEWSNMTVAVIDFPHPLLWQYLVAACVRVFGESEIPLHLLTLLAALPGILGMRGLAIRLGVPPLPACTLMVGTSGFLVMVSSVMPDVAAMSLTVAAIDRLVAAVEGGRLRDAALAGLLAGAAFLTRFSASIALALLLAYPLFRRRVALRAWLPLVIALTVAGAWELWSLALAGRPHFLTSLARWSSDFAPSRYLRFSFNELTFLGAQLPLTGLALFAVGTRDRIAPILLGVALLGAAALPWAAGMKAGPLAWAIVLFAWPGLLLVLDATRALAAAAVARFAARGSEEALRWVLALWLVAGTFATTRYAHVGVKHLLLPLPAAILLVLDGLWQRRGGVRPGHRAFLWASCCVGAALALGVAVSDQRWANGYRRFVEQRTELALGERTWFNAQWGLRFYAERAGWRPYRGGSLSPEDRLIVSSKVPLNWALPGFPGPLLERVELSYPGPFELLSRGRAGFYSNSWGAWPFWPSSRVRDTIRVYAGAKPGPEARGR
jgi:hypothetical protein